MRWCRWRLAIAYRRHQLAHYTYLASLGQPVAGQLDVAARRVARLQLNQPWPYPPTRTGSR